jgi:predicted AAA+ superfamily ATPase
MNKLRYERYTAKNIKAALYDTPVVFLMGARQSGKTTLVKSLIKENNWVYINLDDRTQLTVAQEDPISFIRNLDAKHIVIDEIQRLPELLLIIKQSVDEDRSPGRFLLTGSANALVLPKVSDSLAGRVETILLNPLSECEIKNTKPSFLMRLINLKLPTTKVDEGRSYLLQRITSGCFPEPIQRKTKERIKTWYKQYINSLIQKDIKEIEYIDHPDKMLKLLKLTAYYSGKLTNFAEIGHKLGLDRLTIKKYIGLLEQLFLLKRLPAWHINEYKRLVKTPKLHLSDTGLICAIRDIDSDYLLNNPGEIGSLLETFVINELQKQAVWLEQDVSFYHYRDKDKLEIDCIIENARGDCFAVEVKASSTLVSRDFHGLKKFKNLAGDHFKFGILLYGGNKTMAFGDKLFAVPIESLWG